MTYAMGHGVSPSVPYIILIGTKSVNSQHFNHKSVPSHTDVHI